MKRSEAEVLEAAMLAAMLAERARAVARVSELIPVRCEDHELVLVSLDEVMVALGHKAGNGDGR